MIGDVEQIAVFAPVLHDAIFSATAPCVGRCRPAKAASLISASAGGKSATKYRAMQSSNADSKCFKRDMAVSKCTPDKAAHCAIDIPHGWRSKGNGVVRSERFLRLASRNASALANET